MKIFVKFSLHQVKSEIKNLFLLRFIDELNK